MKKLNYYIKQIIYTLLQVYMDIRSFFEVIPSKKTSNNEISKFAGPEKDIHGDKKVIIDTFMKNVKGKKYVNGVFSIDLSFVDSHPH